MLYEITTRSTGKSDHFTGRAFRMTRRSLLVASAAGMALLAISGAPASSQTVPAFELRPMAGAYVPLGGQKNFVNDATLLGAQGSWLLTPSMALTASAGWARSEARQLPTAFNRLDLWTYDAGVEARIAPPMSESMTFAPFVGIGAGARTYDYRDMDVDSETYMAGYGALGGEVGYKSMGIRLEARDYLSRFRLPSGERDTRNDLTLSAALNLRIW